MSRLPARPVAWVAGLLAALVVLRLAGGGDLAPPPLGSLDALDSWVSDRGPASVAIALVRFGAELTVWYLLGLSLLHAIGAALRVRGIAVLADALALPGATRLVRAGLGFGLLASTAITAESSVAPASAQRAGVAAMQPTDDDRPAATGTATMAPLDQTEPAPTSPAAATVASTYRVEKGDSCWQIAEDTLAQTWGRQPTDAEIDPYWRSLVETNRDRLVSGDPDLILPGQVFELPPPPPPPPPA